MYNTISTNKSFPGFVNKVGVSFISGTCVHRRAWIFFDFLDFYLIFLHIIRFSCLFRFSRFFSIFLNFFSIFLFISKEIKKYLADRWEQTRRPKSLIRFLQAKFAKLNWCLWSQVLVVILSSGACIIVYITSTIIWAFVSRIAKIPPTVFQTTKFSVDFNFALLWQRKSISKRFTKRIDNIYCGSSKFVIDWLSFIGTMYSWKYKSREYSYSKHPLGIRSAQN